MKINLNDKSPKKRVRRSPNFPSINLERALELARKLYDIAKTFKMPEQKAHEVWGYKAFGSVPGQHVAALGAFGLLDVVGKGQGRQVLVSKRARHIILDADDREDHLRAAALSPKIHNEIWEHYGRAVPPEEVLKNYLIFNQDFNEDSVAGFISQFQSTIAFAKLEKSDLLPIETEGHGGSGLSEQKNGPEPQTPNSFGEQMNAVVAPEPASAVVSTTGPKVLITRDFSIPRKAGRLAILRLEYPISSQDIDQIRSWLDLMGNTISDDEELSD